MTAHSPAAASRPAKIAEVAGKGKPFDIRFRLCEPGNIYIGIVHRTIIHEDDFKINLCLIQNSLNCLIGANDIVLLIIGRNY